jgi:hypothetical protein
MWHFVVVQYTDRMCSSRETDKCNVVWITTECLDVGLYPFEHHDLVSQT